MIDVLRVYDDPASLKTSGYPALWDRGLRYATVGSWDVVLDDDPRLGFGIKDLVRDLTDHRCVRCGHPYRKGTHGNGEWSPCDENCTHGGPARARVNDSRPWQEQDVTPERLRGRVRDGVQVEAKWRILTVHHANGQKHDCRWHNLLPLCQRDHLAIQSKVVMERVYPFEHSEWFKPYVAGYYASAYLGEELTREQTLERLDELLALERQA